MPGTWLLSPPQSQGHRAETFHLTHRSRLFPFASEEEGQRTCPSDKLTFNNKPEARDCPTARQRGDRSDIKQDNPLCFYSWHVLGTTHLCGIGVPHVYSPTSSQGKHRKHDIMQEEAPSSMSQTMGRVQSQVPDSKVTGRHGQRGLGNVY